ncbi:hypothetical protein GA0115249_118118 [Streptomyces sp. PpalLS-921]|nr:hypothetical protein GA0115249_118118 [Streptomyces sp. PpalLS-921]
MLPRHSSPDFTRLADSSGSSQARTYPHEGTGSAGPAGDSARGYDHGPAVGVDMPRRCHEDHDPRLGHRTISACPHSAGADSIT